MVKIFKKPFQYQNKTSGNPGNPFCCALIALIFLLISTAKLYGNEISNSEVKASWILNIVEWLNWREAEKTKNFAICTIGRDKVHMYLKRLAVVNRKKFGDKFAIYNKSTEDDFSNCHILYISDSEQEYYMNILERANNKKIITISSINGFARHGGGVEFVIRKKARLIINLKTIKNAKVIIDDELYGWVETVEH